MRSSRDSNFILAFISILFLIQAVQLRLLFLLPDRMWPDEALYAWKAKEIFQNWKFLFSPLAWEYHSPLIPAVLSVFHFFYEPETACRIGMFWINLLGVLAMFWIGTLSLGIAAGLLGAVFLAFHFSYILHANMILLDAPLTVGFILFAIVLIRTKIDDPVVRHIVNGIFLSILILIRWSGFLAVLMTAIFYFGFLTGSLRQKWKPFSAAVCAPVLLVGILWGLGIHPVLDALSGMFFKRPFWFYMTHPEIFGPVFFVVIFFITYFWAWIKRGDSDPDLAISRNIRFLGTWFLVGLVAVSFSVEKDIRYVLPLVPFYCLVNAYGIVIVIRHFLYGAVNGLKRAAVFLFVIGLLGAVEIDAIRYAHEIFYYTYQSYVGLREGGVWLKERCQADDCLVFATPRRGIRYFGGFDFKEHGGSLYLLPEDPLDMTMCVTERGKCFLWVDRWEYTQPSWVWPLTKEKEEKILAAGFEWQKVIVREVMGKEIPVVWIYGKI